MSEKVFLVVLSMWFLLASAGIVLGDEYEDLFDSHWLPLVHDWTQQLHEPRGAAFRQVSVPQDRSIYWEYSEGNIVWSEIQLRRRSDGRSQNIRRGDEEILELISDGTRLFVRAVEEENGFPIATYQRIQPTDRPESIAGGWDFRGRPLTIVEVPYASTIEVFVLYEDVPVVDIPRGAYIVERVADGVIQAQTFGVFEPFYILFDPTDAERLWLTTEKDGPDIEPWVDRSGLTVAYLRKLDSSRIQDR